MISHADGQLNSGQPRPYIDGLRTRVVDLAGWALAAAGSSAAIGLGVNREDDTANRLSQAGEFEFQLVAADSIEMCWSTVRTMPRTLVSGLTVEREGRRSVRCWSATVGSTGDWSLPPTCSRPRNELARLDVFG